MKAIGIDRDRYLVYEGQRGFGEAVWPQPTILVANIAAESAERLEPAPQDLLQAPFVFVDEAYDPVSRVRKGRMFKKPDFPVEEWHVHPHPARLSEVKQTTLHGGLLIKQLACFWEFGWATELHHRRIERPLVLLGSGDQFTVWSVIAVEASYSGEAIIYLRARKSFGALPRINYALVPEKSREQVRKKIDYLAAENYIAGPESIVDAAREALTAILSAYVQEQGLAREGSDLGKLVKALTDAPINSRKSIVINLADTVRLLHSRRKNAVQEQFDIRPITEQDAELAVLSVGTVLCDFGWAEL